MNLKPRGATGWTLDTLYVYLATLLEKSEGTYKAGLAQQSTKHEALQASFEQWIKSTQEATAKAERATELRFQSVDDFRSAMANQITNFVTVAVAKEAANTAASQREQLAERISMLEQANAQASGKQQVADPQIALLATEVRNLSTSRTMAAGRDEGIKLSWGVLVAFGGGLVGVLTIVLPLAFSVFNTLHTSAPTPPQIIYVPAPAPIELKRNDPAAPK